MRCSPPCGTGCPVCGAALDRARAAGTPVVYVQVTILAGACATTDEELERLAFEYAERVVRARVDRAS